MSEKIIPEFDERGLLPYGFYCPELDEFIHRFVSVINMERRQGLFEKYSAFCLRCLDTNALVAHYVNGSYTTTKEKPRDVDLLITLDGSVMDDSPDEIYDEYWEFKDYVKMKDLYCCHTFCTLEYSKEEYSELYLHNEGTKQDVIGWWKTNFLDEERTVRDPVEKGVIILSKDEIDKIRSI